jgi:hypothetical protein
MRQWQCRRIADMDPAKLISTLPIFTPVIEQ